MPEVLIAPSTTEEETEEKSVKKGLQDALAVLQERGWCQHVLESGDGRVCMLGAIWQVRDDDPAYFSQMGLVLLDALGKKPVHPISWPFRFKDGSTRSVQTPDFRGVSNWNDAPGRTSDEVETVFEYAIEKAEE
jgi:hypothetical protein